MAGPPGRAFAKVVGPKAEFVKSVSVAFGRDRGPIKFGLAAMAFAFGPPTRP